LIANSELASFLRALGHELDLEEVAQMVKTFDTDGSGDIGFPEFVQLIREKVLVYCTPGSMLVYCAHGSVCVLYTWFSVILLYTWFNVSVLYIWSSVRVLHTWFSVCVQYIYAHSSVLVL
jgi:hypothetical protein